MGSSLVSFVTGISGSERLQYLHEVSTISKQLEIVDVGELMFKKSETLGITIPEGKILDMDPLALDYLRAVTFEDILRKANNVRSRNGVLAISTHACFRWKKHLTHAFNFYYLNQIDPDVYINIVDNVHYIWAKLEESQWRGRLSLKDILVWRDEEAFITRILAEYRRKPFYLVSRREDPGILKAIIYDVEKAIRDGRKPLPKAYLSYPITYVKGNEDFMKSKEEIKKVLRESGIVLFDPIAIEEMDIVGAAIEAKKKKQNHIELEIDDKIHRLKIEDVLNAAEDIKDQIVVRDYQLINQSDMIVVYYPITTLSPGVLSEINYGFTHNKEVYAIFPHESWSPFFEYYTTRIFKDVDSLLDYLRETGRID